MYFATEPWPRNCKTCDVIYREQENQVQQENNSRHEMHQKHMQHAGSKYSYAIIDPFYEMIS
jgi:hypothetical protein